MQAHCLFPAACKMQLHREARKTRSSSIERRNCEANETATENTIPLPLVPILGPAARHGLRLRHSGSAHRYSGFGGHTNSDNAPRPANGVGGDHAYREGKPVSSTNLDASLHGHSNAGPDGRRYKT